jgi:hypothetical protein
VSINDYGEDLYSRIGDLDLGEKSKAYGITMKVVHEGYESLTSKQRYVYDTQVAPFIKGQAEEEEIIRHSDPD